MGKQKTPVAPKSGKKSIGQATSPKIGKTPPQGKGKNKKQTPVKAALKGKKGGPPKKKLEDLSESDVDSDEDFGMDGEEFGPLSDDSSSDEEQTQQLSEKKGKKAAEMEVEEDDDDDEEDESEDEAPALVNTKQATGKKNAPKKGEQATPKAAKTNGQKSPALNESKSIYIGNLPSNVTVDQIRNLFTDCGVVQNIKLITDPKSKQCKGYGFVSFADEESIAMALKKQGVSLNDQELKISRRTDASNVDRNKAVYVGNMPFSLVTEENVRKLFGDCGEITTVAIPKNNSGKPRGFAVVNFVENESVQAALKKAGTQVEDRQIVVRLVTDTWRTVNVDNIKPKKGGMFGAAACLKDLLNDCTDVVVLTLKKKSDSDFSATVNFESSDSAKKAAAKSGSQVGQGPVTVELVDQSKQHAQQQQKVQKGNFGQTKQNPKKPFNKGNNQKKPFQGAGSPKKQQTPGGKGVALKNKTKQKLEMKKEASKKKLNKQS